MAESFDFRSRYVSMLRYVVFALLVFGIAFGIVKVWEVLNYRAKLLTCKHRCRELGKALTAFRDNNGNKLPRWLTDLSPKYVKDPEAFLCPADQSDGEKGCFPDWLQEDPEFRRELNYADLDGPSWDPLKSEDTIPCSYFYRFNHYPFDVTDRSASLWSEIAEGQVEDYGNAVPVVQCFWHLEEGTPDNGGKVPSLLYDLIKVETYPKKWRTSIRR